MPRYIPHESSSSPTQRSFQTDPSLYPNAASMLTPEQRDAIRHAPDGIFNDPDVKHDLAMGLAMDCRDLAAREAELEAAYVAAKRARNQPASYPADYGKQPGDYLTVEAVVFLGAGAVENPHSDGDVLDFPVRYNGEPISHNHPHAS